MVEFTGVDALEWSEEVVSLGAGELLVTSVDKEGLAKALILNYWVIFQVE